MAKDDVIGAASSRRYFAPHKITGKPLHGAVFQLFDRPAIGAARKTIRYTELAIK
ncbi:hypothetical protein [Ralstonia sp. 1138]|uniref:hypothetical protein n=1 Tax=Ralstonia sp. 1138 TaxID=3156423 RepID=UPI0033987BAE